MSVDSFVATDKE